MKYNGGNSVSINKSLLFEYSNSVRLQHQALLDVFKKQSLKNNHKVQLPMETRPECY